MADLKNKIINTMNDNSSIDGLLNNLSKLQDNLLKNYSNPVFTKNDREKILKRYIDLQAIGQSIYKYDILKKHNNIQNAQDEKENIERKVLKGGVSYNKYVWHSENGEHTCDICAGLDGQEFDFYEEVPERPHPNCRCTVEIVENDNENSSSEPNEDEESCDCWDKIDDLVAETDSWQEKFEPLISELDNIDEETHNLLNEIQIRLKNAKVNYMEKVQMLSEYYYQILKKGIDVRRTGLSWVVVKLMELNSFIDKNHFPTFLNDSEINYLMRIGVKTFELNELVKLFQLLKMRQKQLRERHVQEDKDRENQIKEDTKEIAKHEEQIKALLNLAKILLYEKTLDMSLLKKFVLRQLIAVSNTFLATVNEAFATEKAVSQMVESKSNCNDKIPW